MASDWMQCLGSQWLIWAARFLVAIEPAWAHQSTSQTSASWFNYETIQLTDEIITNLTTSGIVNASLFDFGTSNSSAGIKHSLSSGQCKTFPGDADWPSANLWDLADSLLGGALIKTVPLASPCYHNWGNYDADVCALVTANWSDWSYMQCVSIRRLSSAFLFYQDYALAYSMSVEK